LFDKLNKQPLILSAIFVPISSILISIVLYIINDASFSFITHYLSDLGAGPNGVGLVFSVGMIITSAVTIFFFLHLSTFLINKKGNKYFILIGLISGVISSIGTFFVGIFPINIYLDLHNFSASLFFLGGFAYCLFFAISELTTPGISKIQALSGFVVCFFFFVFIFYSSINYYDSELCSIESYISEWILFFVLISWIIEHEIYIFNMSRKKSKSLSL